MTEFNKFKSFSLKGSVGNMMENNEEDVINVKNALFRTGHRKTPAQNGIIEQETDDAIRSYQKEKGLKIDGILKPKGETEKAMKSSIVNLMLPPLGLPWNIVPELNFASDRKEAILRNKPAKFKVEENAKSSSKIPFFEIDRFNTVRHHEKTINQMASKYKVDPDLVKATMYMETTHGWYEAPKQIFDKNETILPMNIHAKYWEGLGYSRSDLKNPENNI